MIRRDHHKFLRNLPGGRNRRLIEVPIEVTLSSDEEDDPSEVHPVPAEEPNSDCSLLNSTTEREAPKARDSPLEAVPIIRMPRLTKEQREAMFTESLSEEEEEEDEVALITLQGGSQLPASSTPGDTRPGDTRPTSAASSRYHPTTPL